MRGGCSIRRIRGRLGEISSLGLDKTIERKGLVSYLVTGVSTLAMTAAFMGGDRDGSIR
jgi:hypothetical protein